MPLNRLAKLFSGKPAENISSIIIRSPDDKLKKIIDEIAPEIGASTANQDSLQKNSFSIKFIASEKLLLRIDPSKFADGFVESLTRNLGKIWQQDFEVLIEKDNKSPGAAVKIEIPFELYPRVGWFIYMFLEGLSDKRIGRRWIK